VSDRSSGGPVLRKRGARRQEQSESEQDGARATPPSRAASEPATPSARPGGPGRPPSAARGGREARAPERGAGARGAAPRRGAGGRRLYDPKADGAGVTASPEGDPRRAAARDPKAAMRKPPPGTKPAARRPIPGTEKVEVRTEAQALAKDKGIPLVHAYRIVKGQATLNEVLKGMMRKERFEQLVTREGIDRELAGQVASGHLTKQRALTLSRMRALRGNKLHVDGITAAEGATEAIALDFFGAGWRQGKVTVSRAYDFDFLVDGAEAPETHFKHDVKALCLADDLGAVARAVSADEVVQSQGLVGTEDRGQRVRPDDEWMIQLIEGRRTVRFTMRDGETFVGELKSFGKWDAELVLPGSETVTVFFHGLHPVSQYLGLKELSPT